MTIWPFCYTSPKWGPLMRQCVKSWERVGRFEPMTAFINPTEDWSGQTLPKRIRNRLPGIEIWPDAAHCGSFFDILKQLAADGTFANEDYLVHLDNDMMFLTPEIFGHIKGADIYGFPGSDKLTSPRLGQWAWFSGFCIFFRVGALRKMVGSVDLDAMLREIESIGGCHIFDVVMPYLMEASGATRGELPWSMSDQNIEGVFRGTKPPASVVHLAGMWTTFLGQPADKWGIPKVLEDMGGFDKLLEVYA